MNETTYVLGTEQAELHRLGLQHQVWAAEARRGWELGGFRAGHTLLDLGCGPGFCTVEMAYLVGAQGKVIGIDFAEEGRLGPDRRTGRAGTVRAGIAVGGWRGGGCAGAKPGRAGDSGARPPNWRVSGWRRPALSRNKACSAKLAVRKRPFEFPRRVS